MSRLDLVIFGATGFTGKHVVMEMNRQLKRYPLSWGIAGRSQAKLEEVIKEAAQKTGSDVSASVIIADVNDEKSLKNMCSQAKVLVNCCGPYRHYGEAVVKAAIESKTHYVDIAAEPIFIESMYLKYNQAAREAGVYVISACGFDSIPTDLGVVFLENNFGGIVNSVESYITADVSKHLVGGAMVNYGTWESLIYGILDFNKLPDLMKKIYPEQMPEFNPELKARYPFHRRLTGRSLPLFGADAPIVYRTQRTLYERDGKRPIQHKTYIEFAGISSAMAVAFFALIGYVLLKLRCIRNLFLNHPRVFTLGAITREGPSEEVMNSTIFSFVLFGEGWSEGTDITTPPDKKLAVKVSGVNPAYGATVVALLFSALTILTEKDKMPKETGVLTTGIAFKDTNIIKHLHENNLNFEVINETV
ncbi:saccharopine dehydrogenase-like oxidoreductase isoform X1 [Pieris napi]|uniref:saccharopine dehydrogenase-like oxidoreductase isoform X1 n=1 Tax=Pieris napi TaxID=78633 RepID=UPI001FBAE8FC|nr:saccharopine dehydrogenase-like oxidoreductase isoform X1 [Pieris napi]XP_047518021.1 saccharopine dehydrogenase-like oxidoreductase isoform X1 [Pieris napi]